MTQYLDKPFVIRCGINLILVSIALHWLSPQDIIPGIVLVTFAQAIGWFIARIEHHLGVYK